MSVVEEVLNHPSMLWGDAVETNLGRAYVTSLGDLKGTLAWRNVLASRRIDHRSLEITEETIRQDFEYHYFVLEDRLGRVRDIQPFFVHTQDLLAGKGPAVQRLARVLRWAMPRALTMRTLMVGSPAGEAVLGDGREDADWSARALLAAISALAPRYGASLLVLKEFPKRYRDSLECFQSHGYTRIASMPFAKLDLDFANFEEYMQGTLGKVFRKNLRRKFRDADRAGRLTMQVVADASEFIDEIYPLYLQVYNRSKLRFVKLTPDYLRRIGRECGDTTRFFIWRHGGRAVAFSLCRVHDGAIWDEYLGLEYDVALDMHLYFCTFRDLINWACAQGLRRYYTTALGYDPKLHLKCELVPLDLYVRHVNPVSNILLKPFLKLLQPTRSDLALARFPNTHEL